MTSSKTHLVIGVTTLIVCATLAVLVELFLHDHVLALFVVFGSAVVGLEVDRRFDAHDSIAKSQNSTVQAYEKLRKDRCPLFSKAAQDKWNEAEGFIQNLISDVLLIEDVNHVYQVLEFLFCDTDSIKQIYATSHGELDEWTDAESWWGENYLQIHERADERGVKLNRIFILTSESERNDIVRIVAQNEERNVHVKIATERRVSVRNLGIAGNCLIFADRHGQPIYVLQATHDKFGRFERAEIFRDAGRMGHIIEAYKAIDSVSAPYHDPTRSVPSGNTAA